MLYFYSVKFKYIQNINNDVAEIRIYKRIGASWNEDGVNGSDFANEMAYLQDKCKQINVRINSGGGSVIDSYSIISAMLNSKVPVDTYIDGIAASAAASIAVAGRKVYMVDYGVFMIHNASDPNDESTQAVLDIFNKSINTILTNRTKLCEAEISKMMEAESWMDADACLAMGFIDSIVSTEKKVKVKPTASVQEAYAICNELLTKKPNMKEVAKALNLTNEATELEIVKSIEAKDAKIAELTNKLTAHEAEKTAAIEAAKVALKNKAEALVNKAEVDKKIKAEEKAGMIANASSSEENYNFVASMLEKISNVRTPETPFDAKSIEAKADERKDWKYSDWERKDPAGLAKMQNESPEKFNALVESIPQVLKSKW